MRMKSWVPALVLALGNTFFSAAGCAGGDADVELPAIADDDAAAKLPAELRDRALQHIARAVEQGIADEWRDAGLGEVRAILRPDVDGIAYFEVAVERAGEGAGFIVLSTGAHDYPIVEWNTHGTRPSERLRERAQAAGRTIAHYYRLDIDYVGESADGEIAASGPDEGPAPLAPGKANGAAQASWSETKAHFAEDNRAYLDALRTSAGRAWNATHAGARFGDALSSPTYCRVNGSQNTPQYRQLRSYEPPNGRWYASGCAATAWMLMIGWADIQADEGDPKWAYLKGLYRQGGSSDYNTPDARAPRTFDWGVRVMTDAIANTLGTWGVPDPDGQSQGATEPWRMSRITDFLNNWGMGGSVIATTFDWGGGQFDSLRDRAVYHICSDQSPAVVGIGAMKHYALATETYFDGSTRYLYLNMGHGGSDDGWKSPGVYFAGTLAPQHAGPEGASAMGMEIVHATYGGNCGAREGNVSQFVSSSCNNTRSCSYYVDHRAIGDPAVGCAKTFDVQYRCSGTDYVRGTSVGAEASGQSVNLWCPTINVVSATYGGNCGAASGNLNNWTRAVCNGRTQCHAEIDYHIIGDPVPGCAKDFVAQYQCAGGAVKTATVAPEAGYNKVLNLSCP